MSSKGPKTSARKKSARQPSRENQWQRDHPDGFTQEDQKVTFTKILQSILDYCSRFNVTFWSFWRELWLSYRRSYRD
jgi:hypothetical protein